MTEHYQRLLITVKIFTVKMVKLYRKMIRPYKDKSSGSNINRVKINRKKWSGNIQRKTDRQISAYARKLSWWQERLVTDDGDDDECFYTGR